MARELRPLVFVEALALAALVAGTLLHRLPITLPIALPLLVVATLSRWLRGRGWRELVQDPRALGMGAVAGFAALALAAVGFGAFDVSAIEWWLLPAARGDASQLLLALGFVTVTSIALELALRGWILERAWELSPGSPTLPIAVAAVVEALVIDAAFGSRIGAALFGAGLGILYVGCRRSVLAPIAARVVFSCGAIIVELLRA
jgi:hypothetical protein